MFIQYYTYKSEDYLTDDYFVDSMLNPTPESETFWKILIDDHKINADEFISAYMTLKGLHENQPEVPVEKIDLLWERITETNRQKVFRIKRFQFIRYAAVACSIVAVVGFSLFTFLRTGKADPSQSIADFARENIIHTKQPTNKIQLVSGSNTLAVEGVQAKVEYDTNGDLKVNRQVVAANQPTDLVKDIERNTMV